MTTASVGISDLHVHIQPWRQMKPAVAEVMRRGKEDHWDFLLQLMDDPTVLLEIMDRADIWRVGLINYPSQDLMGFTDETNVFAANYAQAAPDRLLPYGGVHPRFTKDPEGQVEELVVWAEGGIRDILVFFFFKQKTAYEIYQCDWSSDVCSSDLDRILLSRLRLDQQM